MNTAGLLAVLSPGSLASVQGGSSLSTPGASTQGQVSFADLLAKVAASGALGQPLQASSPQNGLKNSNALGVSSLLGGTGSLGPQSSVLGSLLVSGDNNLSSDQTGMAASLLLASQGVASATPASTVIDPKLVEDLTDLFKQITALLSDLAQGKGDKNQAGQDLGALVAQLESLLKQQFGAAGAAQPIQAINLHPGASANSGALISPAPDTAHIGAQGAVLQASLQPDSSPAASRMLAFINGQGAKPAAQTTSMRAVLSAEQLAALAQSEGSGQISPFPAELLPLLALAQTEAPSQLGSNHQTQTTNTTVAPLLQPASDAAQQLPALLTELQALVAQCAQELGAQRAVSQSSSSKGNEQPNSTRATAAVMIALHGADEASLNLPVGDKGAGSTSQQNQGSSTSADKTGTFPQMLARLSTLLSQLQVSSIRTIVRGLANAQPVNAQSSGESLKTSGAVAGLPSNQSNTPAPAPGAVSSGQNQANQAQSQGAAINASSRIFPTQPTLATSNSLSLGQTDSQANQAQQQAARSGQSSAAAAVANQQTHDRIFTQPPAQPLPASATSTQTQLPARANYGASSPVALYQANGGLAVRGAASSENSLPNSSLADSAKSSRSVSSPEPAVRGAASTSQPVEQSRSARSAGSAPAAQSSPNAPAFSAPGRDNAPGGTDSASKLPARDNSAASAAAKPVQSGNAPSGTSLNQNASPQNYSSQTTPAPAPQTSAATAGATTAPSAMQATIERNAAWADQIARGVKYAVTNGRSEIRMTLNPPSMGAVRLALAQTADTLTIQIRAQQSETGSLLRDRVSQLQNALETSGAFAGKLNVKVEVEYAASAQPDRQQQRGSEQRQSWQGHSSQHHAHQDDHQPGPGHRQNTPQRQQQFNLEDFV